MKKLRIIVSVTLLFFTSQVFPDVYKWTDSKGSVHFSDRPVKNAKRKTKIPKAKLKITRKETSIEKNSQIIKLKIRRLLEEKKFDKLNILLANYQSKVDSDISFEEDLSTAYNAFRVNDKKYLPLINAWVDKTPSNYQPYLARAKYFYNQGWVKRGSKWRSETKDEQIEEMTQFFKKALKDIGSTLEINEKAMEVYPLMIGILMALGDKDSIETVKDKGLKLFPLSYQIRYSYLTSLLPRWNKSPIPSFVKFEYSLSKSSSYSAKNPRLKLLDGLRSMDSADNQVTTKAYNNAEKRYTQALEAGISHYILFKRGKNYYRQENYESAIEDLNRSIEIYPENANYYYWRSKVLGKQKEYKKSIKDLKMAEKLSPNDKYFLFHKKWLISKLTNIGHKKSKANNAESALSSFDKAISLNPNDSYLYFRKARANINVAKYALAVDDLKKAISLNPNEFDYYHNLDFVLAKQRKWNQIIKYWNQFIELHPDNSRAYVERGGAYFHKGNIRASLKDAKFASDLGNVDGRDVYNKYKHLLK